MLLINVPPSLWIIIQNIFFQLAFTLLLILTIFLPGYIIFLSIQRIEKSKIRLVSVLFSSLGIGILQASFLVFLIILLQVPFYSIFIYLFLIYLYGFFVIKRNILRTKSHLDILKKYIVNFFKSNLFLKFAIIVIFFILSILPGLLLKLPNADDPKGHSIQLLLMFDQQSLFPDWTGIITKGFYLNENLYYPPLPFCFLLWFYSFMSPFNINMGFFFNNGLRFTFSLLFIMLCLFYKRYFNKYIIEIIFSLIILTPLFLYLPKWGGFPFIFSLILLLLFINCILETRTHPNIFWHFFILLFFLAIALSHFNVLGFSIVVLVILTIYRVFHLKKAKYVWSFVLILFVFTLFEVMILLFESSFMSFFTNINLEGVYTFIYSRETWSPLLWDYVRAGQTGQIALFQTGNYYLDLFVYYFSFFYFPFIFALILSLLFLIKKYSNSNSKFHEILLLFIFGILILSIFQFQILVGNFIFFPLAAYLFRIERLYIIIICILAPILSGYFIKEYLFTFVDKQKNPKYKIFRRLLKDLKKIKKVNKYLNCAKDVFFILLLVFSLGINIYVITFRTAVYYNDDVLQAYNWIENYNGTMVILNDPYAQFLPLYTYQQNKTICYPYYSSKDFVYTENHVLVLFSHLLDSSNSTSSLLMLQQYSITHIFICDDKPNILAQRLEDEDLIYSNEVFMNMDYLILVFYQMTVGIFEVNYTLIQI